MSRNLSKIVKQGLRNVKNAENTCYFVRQFSSGVKRKVLKIGVQGAGFDRGQVNK